MTVIEDSSDIDDAGVNALVRDEDGCGGDGDVGGASVSGDEHDSGKGPGRDLRVTKMVRRVVFAS